MKINLIKLAALPLVVAMTQLAAFSVQAADTADNPGQLTSSDYKFAKEATQINLFEVNLGNVAQSNSKNTAVQQFGQHMVADHTKSNQQLQDIASRKGVTLPTEVTKHQQREIDKMSKLTGPEFDKEYLSCMVKGHKEALKMFKKGSEDLQDGDLKSFATSTIPTLEQHLSMAQSLDQQIKNQVSVR